VYDSQGRVLRKVAGVVGTMAIGGLMGRSIYYVTVRSPEGDVRMKRGGVYGVSVGCEVIWVCVFWEGIFLSVFC